MSDVISFLTSKRPSVECLATVNLFGYIFSAIAPCVTPATRLSAKEHAGQSLPRTADSIRLEGPV